MDPLSHVFCSRTLLELGRRRPLHRGTIAAAAVAALAPDADAVLMPAGWDIYLRVHEVGTHSLVGSLVIAGAVTVLVRAVARGAPWRGIALAAAIGTFSHLALDALSGARLQLFWPVSQIRTAYPLVAMADPWLATILLAGAIGLRLARQRARLVSVTALGIAAAFLAFKAMGLASATAAWRIPAGPPGITASVVTARWGSLADWYVFERTPDVLRKWQVTARRHDPALLLEWPVAADSPLIARSRSLDTVQNFLHVHELAFAVEAAGSSGDRRVLWSDLRFCQPAHHADALLVSTGVFFDPDGSGGIACDVWIGGRFSEDGTPLRQIVQVGGWQQTRALGH